jgi:hypothetical protein
MTRDTTRSRTGASLAAERAQEDCMKLKIQLAWSALALGAGIAGCTIDMKRTDKALVADTNQCPVCTPDEFTITLPKPSPTPDPTESPTPDPTESPTPDPTESPTPYPTQSPTPDPTESPTPYPTQSPTPDPTEPTPAPTAWATPAPTPWATPDATESYVARTTSSSASLSASSEAMSATAAEMGETVNFAAALSPEGKACLDGGGSLVQTGVTETSTSVSASYTCDCGGDQ